MHLSVHGRQMQPDLTGAAVHLRGRHLQRRIERRHGLAFLDHEAVAVLPVVEELERLGDLFKGFGGHGQSLRRL